MANYPDSFETKFKMAPGGHGEYFVADAPGYRAGEARINRTNNRLNVTEHAALSQKYLLDTRLKPLFRYGWGVGYNYMVVTKGRIVAGDPYRDAVDWTSDKTFNTLTLANGGVPVKVREDSDNYGTNSAVSLGAQGQKAQLTGLEWAPIEGIDEAYKDGFFRGLKNSAAAQMRTANLGVDKKTGNIMKNFDEATGSGEVTKDIRPANRPLGMIERNEYNRFENDSMDGMQPGPIITDAVVELPYFAFKDKAEGTPWGSIYGSLKIGDMVKSDENGRLTVSPLCVDSLLEDMSAAEIERERQQVVGHVIGLNHDMVPEGGYKWATWALEDRLKYEGFNPDRWAKTNRPGEDAVAASAFASTGKYPGYPYDRAYTEHDLHMMADGKNDGHYDQFMNAEWQYEHLGIPGLTDGFNAAVRDLQNLQAAIIRKRGTNDGEYLKHFVRIHPHGNLVENQTQVRLTKVAADGTKTTLVDFTPVQENLGTKVQALNDAFAITYFSSVQGQLTVSVENAEEADTILADGATVEVDVKYQKRGEAGIPTFMDWDGCVGSAKIILEL